MENVKLVPDSNNLEVFLRFLNSLMLCCGDNRKLLLRTQFDFLGKDSIRYFNTVEVEKPVYDAIGLFKSSKL